MWKYIFQTDETVKNHWHIKNTSNSSGSSFSTCTSHARSPPGKGAGVGCSVPVLSMRRPSGVIHMLKFQPLRWWYDEVGPVDVIKSEAESSRQKSALAKQAWERPSSLLTGVRALKTILLWTTKWSLSSHGICIHLDPGLLSTYNC